MSFTDKEETLVKESWEILEQNSQELGLRFFTKMLEIEPAVKSMFSFLKDSDDIPHNNPQIKHHAVMLFKMVSVYSFSFLFLFPILVDLN